MMLREINNSLMINISNKKLILKKVVRNNFLFVIYLVHTTTDPEL